MDIPRVAHELRDELVAQHLDPVRVLWTDADVLFAGDWDYLPWSLPTFAAGTETFTSSLNSGIIYGNVSALVAAWPALRDFAVKRRFKFTVHHFTHAPPI